MEEVRIEYCEIDSLPKRLKELKALKLIRLVRVSDLQLNAEDLIVFSKLKQLKINCARRCLIICTMFLGNDQRND